MAQIIDYLKFIAPAAIGGALATPEVSQTVAAHPYIAGLVTATLGYLGILALPPGVHMTDAPTSGMGFQLHRDTEDD